MSPKPNGKRSKLVCTCFEVPEEVIAAVILSTDSNRVALVTLACNAGGGCGTCQVVIGKIIEKIRKCPADFTPLGIHEWKE